MNKNNNKLSSIRNLKDFKNLYNANKEKLENRIIDKIKNKLNKDSDIGGDVLNQIELQSPEQMKKVEFEQMGIRKRNPRYQPLNSGLCNSRHVDKTLSKILDDDHHVIKKVDSILAVHQRSRRNSLALIENSRRISESSTIQKENITKYDKDYLDLMQFCHSESSSEEARDDPLALKSSKDVRFKKSKTNLHKDSGKSACKNGKRGFNRRSSLVDPAIQKYLDKMMIREKEDNKLKEEKLQEQKHALELLKLASFENAQDLIRNQMKEKERMDKSLFRTKHKNTYRSFSNDSTFNRNYCASVDIHQPSFLTLDYFKHNFLMFDSKWIRQQKLTKRPITKFNLGFNGNKAKLHDFMKKRFEMLKLSEKEESSESKEKTTFDSENKLTKQSNKFKFEKFSKKFSSTNMDLKNDLASEKEENILKMKNEVVIKKAALEQKEAYNKQVFWLLLYLSNLLWTLEVAFSLVWGPGLVGGTRVFWQFVPMLVLLGFKLTHAYTERQDLWKALPDTLLAALKVSYLIKNRTLPFNEWTYLVADVFWQFVAVDLLFFCNYVFSPVHTAGLAAGAWYIVVGCGVSNLGVVVYYSHLVQGKYASEKRVLSRKEKEEEKARREAEEMEEKGLPAKSQYLRMEFNEQENYVLLIDSECDLFIYDLISLSLMNKLMVRGKFVKFKRDCRDILVVDPYDYLNLYEICYLYQNVEVKHKLRLPHKVRHAFWDSTEKFIFTVHLYNKNLMLFNLKGDIVLKFTQENFKVFTYCVDRHYGHVAVASKEGMVKVYALPTWNADFVDDVQELQTFMGSPTGLKSVYYSPYSNYLVTAGWDSNLKVFTSAEGFYKKVHVIEVCQVNNSIKDMLFSVDESDLCVLSSDNYIRIYSTTNWHEIHRFKNLKMDVTSFCLLNSGEILYALSNRTIELKDVDS